MYQQLSNAISYFTQPHTETFIDILVCLMLPADYVQPRLSPLSLWLPRGCVPIGGSPRCREKSNEREKNIFVNQLI